VRTWLHAEHLIVDGEKMAKSKGNFYTLPDVLSRGYSPRAVRYLLLSVPYRQKLNFTFDALHGAASAVERLESLDARLGERAGAARAGASESFAARLAEARAAVKAGWEDDLNSAAALGALFGFVKEANTALEAGQLAPEDAAAARAFLREADGVLGVLPAEADATLEAEVEAKIAARQDARKRRDFAASDAIRDELAARGILLEDTPQGVRWRRKG
jgi:cysteinyl-tRNA synthetase